MEGGQKFNISLDSGLDVHSSDMLVPAQQPKFQHNRQRFQGKYLPSSVRFEKDGWAAGNDVYSFNFSEVTVEAGSFVVSKVLYNNNPSYKISLKDGDGRVAGSLIYNTQNDIISSDCDECSVSQDTNPNITGSINGKPFNLSYNSVSNEFTKVEGTNITVESTLNSNYTIEVKLTDEDKKIRLSFDGMHLPSDSIYNDVYLLGSFNIYENNKAVWTSDGCSCYYDTDSSEFWIIVDDTEVAGSRHVVTQGDGGSVSLEFDITVGFTGVSSVTLVEFVPFFSGISVSTNLDVVQSMAQKNNLANRWSVTYEDPVNTNSRISDKLYRNLKEYNPEGLNDYNRQRIDQTIPVWFGVTVKSATFNYAGAKVIKPAGVLLHTFEIESGVKNSGGWQTNTIKIYTTEEVQGYDRNIRDFGTLYVWEHCKDVTQEYGLNIKDGDTYTITIPYTAYYWEYTAASVGSNWIKKEKSGEVTFTLDNTYSFHTTEQLEAMIDSTDVDSSALVIHTVNASGGVDNKPVVRTFGYGSGIEKSPFYAGGSLSISYYGTLGVIVTDDLVLKGQLTSLGSGAKYLQNKGTVFPFAPVSTAYICRCCNGHVISDLYIKSENLLTTQIDQYSFGLSPVAGTDPNVLYLNDLFEHQIVNASCGESLSITIYLCAKANNTYMLYSDVTPDVNSDGNTVPVPVCPGHIISGSIKKINDSESGNISAYLINRNYVGTSVDADYGFIMTVTGYVAKDKNNKLYNYISSVESVYTDNGRLPGNSFTEEYSSVIQEALKWDCSAKPQFAVKLNINSYEDYDQLNIIGQDIKHIINSEVLPYKYNLQGSKLISSGSSSFNYSGYNVSVSVNLISDYNKNTSTEIENMEIVYATTADYSVNFVAPKLYDESITSGWQLNKLQNNIAMLQVTDNSSSYICTVNYDSGSITLQRLNTDTGELGNTLTVDVLFEGSAFTLDSMDVRSIVAALIGVYKQTNVEVTGLSSTEMQITVNDEDISVDISSHGLFNTDIESNVEFSCVDVNSGSLEEKVIAKVKAEEEYQLLKQQWDTTNNTENFWWVDDSHVLVLTKDKFILRQKAANVQGYDGVFIDDWDGDVFIDEKAWNRIDYLSTSVLRYFCTSAYDGATAKFITITLSGSTVNFNIYDPLDDMSHITKSVKFQKQNIGSVLCPDNRKLYTYSEMTYANVMTQAKWSGTCVDNKVIIGIHYDNNFNQWAVILSDTVSVIQGYGFVGVNGCLTGGEIPTKYFNVSVGFTGTVLPLSTLSDTSRDISSLSEVYTVNDLIVGNDAQQWYISANIPSIVSHIEYSGGVFTACELKLNNNYSSIYASASYASSTMSNSKISSATLANIMDGVSNAMWTTLMTTLLWPAIYYFNPKLSVANYLQQTLGQAAYVHYNSTSIKQSKDLTKESIVNNYSKEEADAAFDESKEESAVSSDEITFDRQSIKQTQKTLDIYNIALLKFASAIISALDWGQDVLQVNKNQNQSAVKDMGRKYASNFLQNLNSMHVADMTLQSVTPSQTSEVTAIKTLDMFYSTSDKQQVQAGPGYVNHNFVAQCVAQSVTSVQAEFSQQSLLFIIPAISIIKHVIANKSLQSAKYAIEKQLEAMAGPNITFVGMVNGTTVTTPAVVALAASAAAADIACNATSMAIELVPKIIETLGGGKLQNTVTSRLSKHNYDIEGKHKYGSKSECFMWPCFGINAAQSITDESVAATTQNKSWLLNMHLGSKNSVNFSVPSFTTDTPSESVTNSFSGQVPYYIAMIKGVHKNITLPNDMAYVIGAESFLSASEFKNENIGMSEPVFPTAPFQDYIIDKSWNIGQTASAGMTVWVSCKDTKIIDGEYSNCVISDDFCGIAAPYVAIEVKIGLQKQYMRPWAITPQALALNNTGLNCCFEEKAYHAFDGYGYRIVNWLGSAGMNKEHQTWLYSFLVNDRFKRSNKLPQNEFLGNFKCDPVVAISGDSNDKVYTLVTQPGEGKGLQAGTIGEDKDVRRYSMPVFSEFVNTLPATVKTLAAQVLTVIDGVTSLTTENRDLQTAYKAPVSVDFTIGKNKYRYTQEYICSLMNERGVTTVQDLVPCLGLEFIGSTPYEAYFYSQATRQYYTFTGGSSLKVVSMIERFRDVVNGRYDFVNQEVLMPCLATFLRLDKHVHDDNDETDNVMIPRLKDSAFVGEVWPPLETVFNTRSWFRTLSLPCGVTYQGPNRCIINRFVLQDYMVEQIKNNYGLWKRVPREKYHPFRTYRAKYDSVDVQIGDEVIVKGWTHNPFLLVTAPIGTSENIDNMFEWEITFCWPIEMDKLYGINNYAVVNVQAEMMTPGGKVVAERPVHIFLTKELFTRTGNYGYYSFRYQSKCGAGNRERLHIWSDQYVCISSLAVDIKQVTNKRTEQLTQQVDVQLLNEI